MSFVWFAKQSRKTLKRAAPQTKMPQFDFDFDDSHLSCYFQRRVSGSNSRSPVPTQRETSGGWAGLFGNHEEAHEGMTRADSAMFLDALGDDYTAVATAEPDSSSRPNASAAKMRAAA